MQSRLIFQMGENDTLAYNIKASFERRPKKVYIFTGTLKEGGFNIIEEELFDSEAKLYIAMGIDKKNTTRAMLEGLLKHTNSIYIYNNNGLVEFDSSICIFEYTNRAIIYVTSSNLSESGLKENNSLYTEIIYNFDDKDEKKEYKDMMKSLLLKIETPKEQYGFEKLNISMIDKLIESKDIFTTKQYIHNVKSISELLGKESGSNSVKSENTRNDNEDIYAKDIELPKIDFNSDDFDIDDIDVSQIEEETVTNNYEKDFSDIEEKRNLKVEKEEEISHFEDEVKNEEDIEDEEAYIFDDVKLDDEDFNEEDTLDIDDMLFSKADIKLDMPNITKKSNEKVIDKQKVLENSNKKDEKIIDDEELIKVKKLNLNNISNFIFELPNKSQTEQGKDIIKIPNYINKMIPEFFEIADNSKSIEKEDGIYKIRDINLELVDVKNDSKYTDRDAKIIYKSGQSYVTFSTNTLKNVEYGEFDIARIIKLDSKVYHIEIIQKDMQEYKLWNKLCTQQFKSSDRKYGMM